MTTSEIFPFKIEETSDTKTQPIKWKQNNSSYEIHTNILESIELSKVLPHCLEVEAKILAVVTTANHQGPSLFRVFPLTISRVLQPMWTTIINDAIADPMSMMPKQRQISKIALEPLLLLMELPMIVTISLTNSGLLRNRENN